MRFPPPLLYALGFLVGLLLSRAVPLAFPWSAARWIPPVSLLIIVHGVGLSLLGILTFHRANTAVLPHRPARVLVTHGVYSRTRNPIYVGLTVAYLGGVLWTGSVGALLMLPLVLLLLIRLVITPEERHLTARFPAEYAAYCAEVGRWL